MKKEPVVKVKLSNPIQWEDRKIEFVELDFSKVTGGMIVEAEQVAGTCLNSMIKGTNAAYCSNLAAGISGIPYRALLKLPSADFNVIWQTVGAWVNETSHPTRDDDWISADNVGFTEPAETPETPGTTTTTQKQDKK